MSDLGRDDDCVRRDMEREIYRRSESSQRVMVPSKDGLRIEANVPLESEQQSTFSDFIRNATDAEKAKVYEEVMRKATERQERQSEKEQPSDAGGAAALYAKLYHEERAKRDQLERELAEETEKRHGWMRAYDDKTKELLDWRSRALNAEEAAQSATAAIPEGYHLVCKVCGSIPGDVCLAPSRCPVASRAKD